MEEKTVGCKDIGLTCDFVAISKSNDNLLDKMSVHAASEHGIDSIPPHIKSKLEESIKPVAK